MPDRAAGPAGIVLLGGGHAHMEVVRQLGALGLGPQVTLVSPQRLTPYSGMLPGHIAGDYDLGDFHIDLAALSIPNGIRFLQTAVTGIDPERRCVFLADGSTLRYDLLSLDIGATPCLPKGVATGIAVKPIASFTERLARLDALALEGGLRRLAVVGQGVAGVEVAFALQRRFAAREIKVLIVGRAAEPLADRSARTRRLVSAALQSRGIEHHPDFDVVDFADGAVRARDGRLLAADEVVWTTSSGAPAFLRETGISLDERGFVRVDETLRSVSHPQIFAAGDVASLQDPRPKAGVFAVRQGPVLAENLYRSNYGKPLRSYRPQKSWLVLLSLSDGRAIADKWGLSVIGPWVARWKHRIDTAFMAKYRQ